MFIYIGKLIYIYIVNQKNKMENAKLPKRVLKERRKEIDMRGKIIISLGKN
ncbi:hypothetical protein Sjap_023983 [Stephania japonica]|uniref:Uncharacterized protein n=1 Tax=Stephania japonica TaxID=461633 RepID=A0AAP0ECM5_9MAGN